MQCPNCKKTVEYIPGESEICPECGAELASSAAPPPQNANAFAGYDFADVFSRMKAAEPDLSGRTRKMADQIEQETFEPDEKSECPYLDVEYNRNLFFLSGSESIMKLRLTPRDSRLSHILLFMETRRTDGNTRTQIPIEEHLRQDRPIRLQTSYRPEQTSGRIAFIFYIGCKVDGKLSYYQFSVDHPVYDPNLLFTTGTPQVIINTSYTNSGSGSIDNSIRASGAADIHYRNVVEELGRQLGRMPSAHELLDQQHKQPEEFRLQFLTVTTWRPEKILIKGTPYQTDRLKLEWNGYSLLLFGKDCVRFGRDPEQVDLLVRVGGGTIGPREHPNSTVSRFHAEVVYCEDSVVFTDHSTYGTYINGRRPDTKGIVIPEKALIEFGDIHWQMNLQNCASRAPHNICQTCRANRIKSMTFKRTDEEKECYLLVWQCCELGLLLEELTDWSVFFRNELFFIRTPDQEFYHLRPGQSIESNGQKIKVRYFKQN